MFGRKHRSDMESQKALYLARRHLEEVKSREPEVQEVVRATIEFREANHFAEQLISLIQGGNPA